MSALVRDRVGNFDAPRSGPPKKENAAKDTRLGTTPSRRRDAGAPGEEKHASGRGWNLHRPVASRTGGLDLRLSLGLDLEKDQMAVHRMAVAGKTAADAG